MAQKLQLPPRGRDSLVRTALTMNIAMTALQDVLAGQREKPTAAQQDAIRNHPQESQALLERLFIPDNLWLDVVGQHNDSISDRVTQASQEPHARLTSLSLTSSRWSTSWPTLARTESVALRPARDLRGLIMSA